MPPGAIDRPEHPSVATPTVPVVVMLLIRRGAVPVLVTWNTVQWALVHCDPSCTTLTLRFACPAGEVVATGVVVCGVDGGVEPPWPGFGENGDPGRSVSSVDAGIPVTIVAGADGVVGAEGVVGSRGSSGSPVRRAPSG